ncbi:hypothetical protein KJ657_02655 [Patescibacteria group bacterium]|nr:hypothetical protein [Patescibacteria group bacterium]MBU1015968.1 hypothetical protein [Patescibacteria group bacterium]MBU1684823.1 hypothetical protein [Patescibacteria group bacterium]MBU1938793.1 hypothetical protein [Patescibacteria group bacterium]
MFKDLKKHLESEIFAEKRLIFGDTDKPRPSADQLAQDSATLLQQLSAAVEANKKGGRRKPATSTHETSPTPVHTRRQDTRELYRPPEHYEKSVDIAETTIKLKDKLSPSEVQLMQDVQGNLHEQYMNPGFMHYLTQKGLADKVYPALDRVIKAPADFEYRTLGNNTVEIVKRKPETGANKDIDNNFVIVLKTEKGSIARVNDGKNDVNLETTGGIDWMTNDEYNKQMAEYRARFWTEYEQNGKWKEYAEVDLIWPLGSARDKRMIELATEPYMQISADMQKIFELENIQFPNRLIAMIEKRGLNFEQTDLRFAALKDRMTKQGKTYAEMTQGRYANPSKFQLLVIQHPEVKGAYRILMRPENFTEGAENQDVILDITKEGYFLVQTEDGKWQVDPRYKNYVWRDYYIKNPEAQVALTDEQKKELAESKVRIEKDNIALAEAAKYQKKKDKVTKALQKADLDKLKEAAKAITAEADHKYVDEEKNDIEMRRKFQIALDIPDNLVKIAEVLNVNLE